MRDIAIVAYAQTPMVRDAGAKNDIEMVMNVTSKAMTEINYSIDDIDFICSGSCDYLGGAAFAFVNALDGLGIVPSKVESHVEMDAAWALYEAWLKMQCGEAESALIYGFGKSSHSEMRLIPTMQLDPYYYQPLWPDAISLAALQARAVIDTGRYTEDDFASVVVNSRKNALDNPNAQLSGSVSIDDVLSEPFIVDPLRRSDCCPISDGASALIMVTRDKAEELIANNIIANAAYIKGIDHRIDTHGLLLRDLSISHSCSLAAEKAGAGSGGFDIAELYAPFSFQELILRDALGLTESTDVNPSGGALAGHVFMSHGLERIGEVAARIICDDAHRGLAHATSGPCLQQNLVTVLEGA